jgi:hypothetical protein
MNKNTNLLLVFVSFAACLILLSPEVRCQKPRDTPEILLNKESALGESKIRQRDVFVYVDEKAFDLEELKHWIRDFTTKYSEPHMLRISIFTDKGMLRKLIAYEEVVWGIEFKDDLQGKRAEADFMKKAYPSPGAYYQLIYNRYADKEFLDFVSKDDPHKSVRLSLE